MTNGAMQQARMLLRRREEIWGEGNDDLALDSIKRRYGKLRNNELCRDAELKELGELHEQGREGPRVCMAKVTKPLH